MLYLYFIAIFSHYKLCASNYFEVSTRAAKFEIAYFSNDKNKKKKYIYDKI